MNATDLIQSYFDPDAVARLAQAAGLDPETAGRALAAGLPLQLRALAAAAGTPEGEALIADAVEALPGFGSVGAALDEPGGAANLQQAGELLAPALLGDAAETLPAQVAAQTDADATGTQQLLQLALPLLLSALGQRGLKAGNVAPLLAGLGGLGKTGVATTETASPSVEAQAAESVTSRPVGLDKPVPEGTVRAVEVDQTVVPDAVVDQAPVPGTVGPEVAGPGAGVPEVPALSPEPLAAVPPEASGLSTPPLESAPSADVLPDPSTPEGLLKYLQTQFSGAVGQQIGALAGYGGGAKRQAALAALPVVLAALAGKAQAGGNLDTLARPFAPLTSGSGQIDTALLDSPVEVARIEGQGRGLLPSLFGDVNAVTGRLGSALGGSGDSSRRLLALLTPLVLSVLGSARPNGLGAVPWAGLAEGLKGALPSGFSSLGVLIGSLVSGTPLPGAVPAAVPLPRAAPAAAPARPSPLKPARPARFETPAPPPPPPARRRGGFPLWLLPLLLLLLLGGCWVLQNRAPTTPTPVPGDSSSGTTGTGGMPGMPVQTVFTAPESGAAVPAGGFTLRGTGPVGETLTVLLGDRQIGSPTVGPDGTWSLDVADDTPTGPQTYTLRNAAGGEMAALNVVVGATDAEGADTAPAASGGADTGGAETDGAGPTAPEATTPEGAAPAPSGAADGAAGVTVDSPARGAQVSGAGFTLSGTGTAGQSFEVLEDGVSIGRFTVGKDGTWTRPVPAPGEGEKTYAIRSAAGDEVASVPVVVGAAPTGARGTSCTQPLSVSLQDGETVTAPYRFGGEGRGRAYLVTVKRGDRTVGRRTVRVGAGCTWSFTSNPGVRDGQAASVTYEIRPANASASDEPGARLTLNVR
ncbi:hypothetical protein GCM10010840_31380 [Deinococcus aerolatus]|uniref:DUF937 domain-containing protein n=2 Tax=Deinococcus aerolatus TaxID=522487 RepID=A0ABQ2GEJ6_9DEIO|nr:hypothetical protein GCM10010840_31380 [Deinococcus aerolatus]